MNTSEFLESALPADGFYCAVGIKDGKVKPKFLTGIANLIEVAKELSDSGADAYFACATFSERRRLGEYAHKVRSFWLDLDCGEDKAAAGKGYIDKKAAFDDLKKFCKQFNIPKPYVIDSGRGLHVYWLLDEAVSKDDWLPVAKALKKATLAHMVVDPAVTADSARILRVPGTYNFKDKENPRPVLVLQEGIPVTLDDVRSWVKDYLPQDAAAPSAPKMAKRELDQTTKNLMGNYEHKFSMIVRKSLKGTGCAQIAHAITNAATLDYELWSAALSIAYRCDDAATAIHKLSKAHPDYSPEATEKKAADFDGPRTCNWYMTRSGNGKMCGGCKAKVSSPIVLGRVVAQATDAPQESQQEEAATETRPASEVTARPVAGLASLFAGSEASSSSTGVTAAPSGIQSLAVSVPSELPFPYMRGKNGGIYKRERGADGEFTDKQVLDEDLFVIRNVNDPVDGMCAIMRLHPPHDEPFEFSVPLKHMQAPDKFRDIMSEKGIVANPTGMKEIMAYSTSYVKYIRNRMKADEARTQFGWVDSSSKFIWGAKEYSDKGENPAPPSSITRELAKAMTVEGSYEVWREAFNLYVDHQAEAMPQVFALMSAFGSPIIKFAGVTGAFINMYNTRSGTGKTTVQRLINSVYGHPDELMQIEKDTVNAKYHRMGVLNSLCNTFDEMTNTRPEDISDLIYGSTQGRGKNRMQASANIERTNSTRWCSISVSSSNAIMATKLGAHKSTAEGELMRTIEYAVNLVEVPNAFQKLVDLHNNYGHASPIYFKALVKHRKDITGWINKTRDDLIAAVGRVSKERFWLSTMASNLVGGAIAQQLGLHDYDMKALFKWCVDEILRQRGVVKSHVIEPGDILGEFLLQNYGSTLTINLDKINPMSLTNVYKLPTHRITARFEMDKNLLYISKRDFKEYCAKKQGDLDAALHVDNGDYTYIATVKKRMAAGTGVNLPAVEAYEFSVKPEMLPILVSEEKEVTDATVEESTENA